MPLNPTPLQFLKEEELAAALHKFVDKDEKVGSSMSTLSRKSQCIIDANT